jgi:hypothetical protein
MTAGTIDDGYLRYAELLGTLKQLSIEPVIFSDSDSHHEGDREVSLVLSFALPTAPSPYSQQGGSL